MALAGRREVQIEINSSADVFYKLWKTNQDDISKFTPSTIQNCQCEEGESGTVGSIHFWNYFLDGKDCSVKSVMHDINEEKKAVTFKILEGTLLEIYKTFFVHVNVETKGSKHIVTWAVSYEKLNPEVPDPDTLIDLYRKITKDIESHAK